MNFSKTKILLFFVAILIFGWLLYPRELFLAFIYEGKTDLKKAENYYLNYLEEHPYDKFATLRLASLYERMALPEKSTPLYGKLYDRRKKDWDVARAYLDHLENLQDHEKLFQARLKIARNFMTVPHFPVERMVFLLESALEYALWNQKYDRAYDILEDLLRVGKEPAYYLETREQIDRGLKKFQNVLVSLQNKLTKNPDDILARMEILNVYIVLKDFEKAKKVAAETIELDPQNLHVREARIYLNKKLGLRNEVIKDIEDILTLEKIDKKIMLNYKLELAFLYSEQKQFKKALRLYQDVLKKNPKNEEGWLNTIALLIKLDRKQEAIATTTEYLAQFPDDPKREKLLVDLYLYDVQDTKQLELYRAYINKTYDVRYALDVAYLLKQRRQSQAYEQWLSEVYQMFPGNLGVLKEVIGLYLDQKSYTQAAHLIESYLRSQPNHTGLIMTLAQARTLLNQPKEAIRLYTRLAEIKPEPKTFKMIGKEIYFLGQPHLAKNYLMQAKLERAHDPEIWFWLSEVYSAQDEKEKAREAAQQAINLMPASYQDLPYPLKRMYLKSQARFAYNDQIIRDYQDLLHKNPRDADLHSDLIDTHLEHKKSEEAQKELEHFKKEFPAEKERIQSYDLRLAFLQKDWERAIPYLRDYVSKHPQAWSYRRDLAEAYLQAGSWKKGIMEFERVKAATGDEFQITGLLYDLHDEYDKKIRGGYRFTSFDAEDFMEWFGGFHAYLSRNWEFDSEVTVGHFDSPAAGNYENQAVYGRALFSSHHLKKWVFTGGVGFGVSTERTTASPLVGIQFQALDDLRFTFSAGYRQLRTDFPQAVAQGALIDSVEVGANYTLLDRVIFGTRYEFSRTYLPNGSESFGHVFEPGVSFVLLKDPFISVGYQFSLVDQSNENGFLNQVPLIASSKAHYLTGFISKNIKDRLKLEGNIYLGEDTERNLHLKDGALIGAGARIKWRAHENLDIDAYYNFARESVTGISGESHQVGVTLTGHWF